jgi:hypothetical protein
MKFMRMILILLLSIVLSVPVFAAAVMADDQAHLTVNSYQASKKSHASGGYKRCIRENTLLGPLVDRGPNGV